MIPGRKRVNTDENIAEQMKSFERTREVTWMKVGDKKYRKIMFRSTPIGRILTQLGII